MNSVQTIVAPVTPPGRGAVGIVRLSGSRALSIAKQLGGGDLTPRLAHYGVFKDDNGEPIDFGLYLYFKAPHSFTGEEVVELQGHGSPVVMDKLIERIIVLGARMAEPGEFSKRAFLNNKIDLTQAEAIADLINSTSSQAARLAVRSLQGGFSQAINAFRQQLIALRLYIEGAIDFAEEEITFLNQENITDRLNALMATLTDIDQQAKQGYALQEGMTLVIAGLPNAGKSSLLNALSGEKRAIVTDIPGTTRDALHGVIQIAGMPIHVIDTAGLRKTTDPIEQAGINRAWDEISKADHMLWIQDITQEAGHITPEIALKKLSQLMQVPLTEEKMPPMSMIDNKCDLIKQESVVLNEKDGFSRIRLSAKTGQGIGLLRSHIQSLAGLTEQTEGIYLARRRHIQALEKAKQSLHVGKSTV